jgi:MFS family permease
MVGWVAPALLCLLRFGQGFGLGGEWGGAALLAVENAPPGWRARYGMFHQLGEAVGFIAANGLFLLLGLGLTPAQFEAWGWRVPFLLSVVLVGVGLWVRLRLAETPAFTAALKEAPPAKAPMAELLRRFPLETVAGTFAVVACFAIFYITTAFALGYGVTKLGYSRQTFLGVQLGAIGFMAAGIIWAGWWADKTTPRRVLMAGCVATIAGGLLLGPMMEAGSLLLIWAFLSLALVMMGLVYGPLGAFLPSLFPARVRYTGASLSFNVGGIIGGGLTPMAAQALADRGGLVLVGLYLAAAALVSLLALAVIGRRSAV